MKTWIYWSSDATMSLAEASEARKARLTALRKQKAGEVVNDQGCVDFHVWLKPPY